jgi:hypothetical protein
MRAFTALGHRRGMLIAGALTAAAALAAGIAYAASTTKISAIQLAAAARLSESERWVS